MNPFPPRSQWYAPGPDLPDGPGTRNCVSCDCVITDSDGSQCYRCERDPACSCSDCATALTETEIGEGCTRCESCAADAVREAEVATAADAEAAEDMRRDSARDRKMTDAREAET